MASVTILTTLPAAGSTPAGSLTNSTGYIRLTISLADLTSEGSWQLVRKNADSGQWGYVAGAIIAVGDNGGLVGTLTWADPDGSSVYHVVQIRPAPTSTPIAGATGYLSTVTVAPAGPSLGATSVSTLNASGAAVLGSTLSVVGTASFAGAMSVAGVATFNGAPVFTAGLTASGAVANDFSGGSGAFKTSTGLNTFGGFTAQTATAAVLADPGNAGAIPVTSNGLCALTSAAAETRTLADPTFADQKLSLCCNVYVGNIVITASAVDSAAHTHVTFTAAGQMVALRAVLVAGARKWRLASNDGATIS